jgi:hypothetical protein
MGGDICSSGPVNPIRMPSFTSWAEAVEAAASSAAAATKAMFHLRMISLSCWLR